MRLAELLAALSLVTDLARGRPPEEAMRACAVAMRLARLTGLHDADARDVYYTTLLRFVGCTATSHEYAAAFGGDDVRVRSRGDLMDAAAPREVLAYLWALSEGSPVPDRLRAFAAALGAGRRVVREGARADCEVGAAMARRFGLDEAVPNALADVFERWDGKGAPDGRRGEEIAVPARYAAVAFVAVMFDSTFGREAALDVLRRWAGRALDPALARALAKDADAIVVADEDPWIAALDLEPAPALTATERRLDDVANAFADAADLKAPFLHGHSAGVAALGERAAAALGFAPDDVDVVRRAGLLHDIGRAGIATGVWERPGPLTHAESEQVRLHAYHTERVLSRAPALARIAGVAGRHHERLDGSGYHRGAPAVTLDPAARVLAAADAYDAMTHERPYRAALAPADAARELRRMPLDGDAVRAVLQAAGQPSGRRSAATPAGLTDREVEVLRLLARGHSEREIATALVVSPSTVHTHIAHVYAKTGVSTRAAAAMFAMEHHVLRPED